MIRILQSPFFACLPISFSRSAIIRGFEHFYKKDELGTNPKAIAAQVKFLQQTMNHMIRPIESLCSEL
ncbi:hypothetical protein [Tunturiibacter gelidiferens]|uniref:hypothetical protein n=1 Tax=Tunturiibacter gelidiferens TaxID=3069689 RepID=UPI003D9BE033